MKCSWKDGWLHLIVTLASQEHRRNSLCKERGAVLRITRTDSQAGWSEGSYWQIEPHYCGWYQKSKGVVNEAAIVPRIGALPCVHRPKTCHIHIFKYSVTFTTSATRLQFGFPQEQGLEMWQLEQAAQHCITRSHVSCRLGAFAVEEEIPLYRAQPDRWFIRTRRSDSLCPCSVNCSRQKFHQHRVLAVTAQVHIFLKLWRRKDITKTSVGKKYPSKQHWQQLLSFHRLSILGILNHQIAI